MAKKKLTIEDVIVPKEEIPYEVPENWLWTYFGYLCKLNNGYAFKSSQYKEDGVPILRISNISSFGINFENAVYSEERQELQKFEVNKGDLLIAMSGATTGKTGVYNLDNKSYLNQRVGNLKIVDNNLLSENYRNYFILYKSEEILKLAYGGAQPNISAKMIDSLKIPLPPLSEQERIVNRIESLFEKVDKVSELIEEAREGFEKRRAAILEKAFSGELTKSWREENKTSNIDTLINKLEEERILNKIKSIKNKDDIELGFNIPSTWRRVILHDISKPVKDSFVDGPFGSNLKTCDYTDEGVRLIQLQNIGVGFWKDENKKYISENKAQELSRCIAKPGALAIAKMAAPVARAVIVPENEEKYVIVADCIKIDVDERVNSSYIMRCINSPRINEIAERLAKGSTRKRINLGDLKLVPIPLPPKEEQDEIVRILDNILEKEEEIEELSSIFNNIDTIKKSILSKAFRGELGSTDLNEESSIEILKNI